MSDYIPPEIPLRAVVFDLDGLMFNTEDLYQMVGSEVLARRGKEFVDELLNQMMGRKSNDALQLMIDYHNLEEDTVEGLAAESMEIMFELLPARLEPMPGLLELLDSLEAAEIPKGIATSSNPPFVHRVLEQFTLAPRFHFVLTSADIEHGKPAPDVYQLAAAQHGVPEEQVMVLEDSQIGCTAAVAAGTYAVSVPSGHSRSHEFEGVKFVAKSLKDARIYRALGIG